MYGGAVSAATPFVGRAYSYLSLGDAFSPLAWGDQVGVDFSWMFSYWGYSFTFNVEAVPREKMSMCQ